MNSLQLADEYMLSLHFRGIERMPLKTAGVGVWFAEKRQRGVLSFEFIRFPAKAKQIFYGAPLGLVPSALWPEYALCLRGDCFVAPPQLFRCLLH
jgi:hypothetical protein